MLDELYEASYDGENADAFVNEIYLNLDETERAALSSSSDVAKAMRKIAISRMDDETKEAFAAVQVGFGLEDIVSLDIQRFEEDPYYKAVISAMKKPLAKGEWKLEMRSYKPFELFVCDEVKPSPIAPFITYSPLGYFKKEFPFPALVEGDTTYMSLIPHEMLTMAESIKKAHGHVATYGLGMGYFAFMASNKDEVESVTVLERDPKVIEIFKSFFLPLFPHKEKIHIEQDDALLYRPEVPFDYLFVDLYHDATDGLPMYLKLMPVEGLAKETDFWIEKAILEYFRRHVTSLLQEEADGYDDSDYASRPDFTSALLASLHFHLKHVELREDKDVFALLDDENLKRIAKEMKFLPIETKRA